MKMKENAGSNNMEAADQKEREQNTGQISKEYKNKKKVYIVGKGVNESESESGKSLLKKTTVKYQTDDIVCMKKPHPCGSKEWKILRVGADIKIRCEGCGHDVILPRHKFDKQIKHKT